MKNTVFENWMDYVSDGKGKNFEKFLDVIAMNFVSVELRIDICECCGKITTYFDIDMGNDEILCLSAYAISKKADGEMARGIVKTNFQIYRNLLRKLFGADEVKSFNLIKEYEEYLKIIEKQMVEAFGKLPEGWEVA